jgi:serine/threonine protein kinase
MAEDISFDIWSYGCILIDIFSKEHPIFKLNLTNDELNKLYDTRKFPHIPDDINSLLRDIICKCLDYDYMNRITISELSENLNILFDNLSVNSQNLGNISILI